MIKKQTIVALNGSASSNASNLSILKRLTEMANGTFEILIVDDLSVLPHFKTELTTNNTPQQILDFRALLQHADALLICTPEYVFSIPSGLKNALEWCVSTTVLSDKPTGLITASANGEKAHAQLQLIMETLQAKFTTHTTLLIQGVKGKVSKEGDSIDPLTRKQLQQFMHAFQNLVLTKHS